MYDEDPSLFVAGASGTGALALTGSNSWILVLAGVATILFGVLILRIAGRSTRRTQHHT